MIHAKCLSAKGPLTCLQQICSCRVCGFCYLVDEGSVSFLWPDVTSLGNWIRTFRGNVEDLHIFKAKQILEELHVPGPIVSWRRGQYITWKYWGAYIHWHSAAFQHNGIFRLFLELFCVSQVKSIFRRLSSFGVAWTVNENIFSDISFHLCKRGRTRP